MIARWFAALFVVENTENMFDFGCWWCGCGVFVFGFFMIVVRLGRAEICKFQFL